MVFQTALRSLSNRSKVVVGNYCSSPITAEQYREKARPLRPRRSYFAPAETRLATRLCSKRFERAWVEAPGTAPGSEWFIATAIYFHSRRAGTLNIGRKSREKQSPRRPFGPRTPPLGWNTMNTGWPCGAAVLSLDHAPGFAPGCRSGAGYSRIGHVNAARPDRAV